jgi:hypothetical protein
MPSPARTPALAAAAFFAALALLIAKLALAPLGAADLLGISACAAAAGAFATLAFTLRPLPENAGLQPGLRDQDLEKIAATVNATVATALAAAESARRAEQLAALAATTPARALDTDHIPAPSAGAKPRLGRGLLGLMQSPSALATAAKPAITAPALPPADSDDHRAAA